MKKKEGQRILQQLAQQSDVMIENYVPGGWWPQANGRMFAFIVFCLNRKTGVHGSRLRAAEASQ